MSHYYALVVIPAEGDVDELVGEALKPYDENLEVEQYESDGKTCWHNPIGVWDWWQIGGRWTGVLSGYEPDKDPNLTEPCWLCDASGRRNDALGRQFRATNPGHTCNGCDGTGRKPLWPTQWPRHAGDIVPALNLAARLADLPDEALPFSLFAHGSEKATHRKMWDGENWRDMQDKDGMRKVLATVLAGRAKAGLVDRVVVVDYHC